MKRILLSAIMTIAAIMPLMAQSTTTRVGNTYIVGSETMNKKAYEGYLKNTCPAAFTKFHSGRVVSNVGWGCFAGGIGLQTAGIGMIIGATGAHMSYETSRSSEEPSTESSRIAALGRVYAGGIVMMLIGSATEVSGIVMLGVGYGRMHNAADLYNVNCAARPSAYLTPSTSGLGLALHF